MALDMTGQYSEWEEAKGDDVRALRYTPDSKNDTFPVDAHFCELCCAILRPEPMKSLTI